MAFLAWFKFFRLSPVTGNSRCDNFIELKNYIFWKWRLRHTISGTNLNVGKGLDRKGKGPVRRRFLKEVDSIPVWPHYKYLRKCWEAFFGEFHKLSEHFLLRTPPGGYFWNWTYFITVLVTRKFTRAMSLLDISCK